MKPIDKLRSDRGETLAETLAALALCAIALTILATALVDTGSKMASQYDAASRSADESLYSAVSAAERAEGEGEYKSVTVSGNGKTAFIGVNVYGPQDGPCSYKIGK